jgi:hypothetical protein
MGFVEKTITEWKAFLQYIIDAILSLAKNTPGKTVVISQGITAIITAVYLIGTVVLIIGLLYLLRNTYPRIQFPRTIDLGHYFDKVYLPHFMRVRSKLLSATDSLRANGHYEPFIKAYPELPMAIIVDSLPHDDTSCMAFLKSYFRSHNYHVHKNEKFMRYFFPMPPANLAISDKGWKSVETLRSSLSSFATSISTSNPIQTEGFIAKNSQKDGVIKNMATIIVCVLEMHLMLNIYHSSITTKFDSRQKRMWGNPYVFYYFLGKQTKVTGDNITSIWKRQRTISQTISAQLRKHFDALWPRITKLAIDLPRMMSEKA